MSKLIEIASLQNLNTNDNFLVCSFYTQSYETHAMRLKESLDSLNIGYYFMKVEDAGFWEANTRIKPHFILHCLNLFTNKDILYLDSDAVVKQSIDYFNHIDSDIAIYECKGKSGMSHNYLAGTIFFKNNEVAKELVLQWIKEQVNGKDIQVDQDSLDQAMLKLDKKIKVESLPLGYIKIFDKDYKGEVYIEQYQASRSLTKLRRKKIRRRNRIIGIIAVSTIILTCYTLLK